MLKEVKVLFNLIFTTLIISLVGCSSDNKELEMNLKPVAKDVQAPCENGMADIYPCKGYDLVGKLSLTELEAEKGNDVWGWTDELTNKEYALVGLDNGTAFVDITESLNPIYLGKLPTASFSVSTRDIKVFKNHMYVVSDAFDHGVQVFDLTRLRNFSETPVVFESDYNFQDVLESHNLAINEESGFAYAVGRYDSDDLYEGGAYFLDINNPSSPITIGGYGEYGYIHDAQVVTYHGPDETYFGKEILIGSNGDFAIIVDVTDKLNPDIIRLFSYPNLQFAHQAWLTEDHRYLLLGDEFDEIAFGLNSRTLVFDFKNLKTPSLILSYNGPTKATDHNGYVAGDKFYLANYAAGVRIIDLSNLENRNMEEIGFFDTYPADDIAGFNGAWTAYPFFKSGKILINDINSGLFIVKKSN